MSRRPGRSPRPRQRSSSAAQTRQRLLPEPVTIERLSHDGRGIARLQGKALFVEGAMEGERARVRLVSEQSRYAEAEATEVLEPAAHRQEPPCGHYSYCGGCQLQHMAPPAQRQAKQNALLEQLHRSARLEPEQLAEPIGSPSQGYRHRARLGVWYPRSGGVTLGFRRRRSRELTSIDHCEVLAPELNRLIEPLRHWLLRLETSKAITHIELLADASGPAMVLREIRSLSAADLARLRILEAEYGCRIWRQLASGAPLLDSSGRECDPRMHYRLPEFELELGFHPQDFTQVNPYVNRPMVVQAVDWLAPAQGEGVLDLFCGVGNFALPLARRGARVLGLEAAAAMVARSQENSRRNGLDSTQFDVADLAKADLKRHLAQFGSVNAVLLDPPREGARQLLSNIEQLSPQRLVYVSCNPATLARDAAELAAAGYSLQTLGVLDMFPHTAHIESMALFVRR